MITVNKLPYLVLSFLLLSLSSCEDSDPKASFIVEQDPDNKPLYATFTSTSKNAESVHWSMEGHTFTAPVLEYQFSVAGSHPVRLEITNEDGEVSQVTQQVEIPNVPPCGDARRAVEQRIFNQYYAAHNITPLYDEERGYQYTVVQTGNGRKITGRETVQINTYFYLLDGTLVLKSEDDRPNELNQYNNIIVSQLMTMEEGSTVRWFVPSCNAFGVNGIYGKIPPYTPVIQEIQLVKIGPEPCQC